ncbi:unnamed protein product [Staurois parvus]|uniref:Secreted protein n=1 Tax=Staurois parvus TaxID=386267 RepID=A0ABN9H3U1_9NEOB|nr:unnamed protein product [Staurois parvus]
MGTGGWHWCVALLGTGGRTAGWHRWAHCWVAQVGALLGGTGGRTAGWHRWAHCWVAQVGALLGGTGGRTAGHRWAELVCGTAGHRSSGH